MSESAVLDAPETVLTTDAPTIPEGTTSPAPDASAAPEAAPADAPAETPIAPVYEFVAPEGVVLDTALVEKVTPLFAAANLAPEAAQSLVNAYAEHVAAQDAAREESWLAAVKSDPEIGGAKLEAALNAAKRAIHQFGGEELVAALNESRLGNLPALIKAFAKVGAATSEDTTIRAASGGAPQRTAAETLYPSMTKES